MGRDFEQEFRELKQSEIPDLWNRIEAGLSEKTNMTHVSGNAITVEKGRRNIRKRFSWRKWGTLIAACLCVIIIFPAFSLFVRNKSYSESATGAPACDTAAGTASDAAALESAPETSEAIAEEGMWDTSDAAAEEGVWDISDAPAEEPADGASGWNGSDSGADAGGTETSAAAADMTQNTGKTEITADSSPESAAEDVNGMATESAQTEEAGGTEKAEKENGKTGEQTARGELSDGQLLEEAVVLILNAGDGGTFYQAQIVQEDADGLLESGVQIVLVCNDDTSYDFPAGPREGKLLKEDTAYLMTLRYDGEERNFAVVTAENTGGKE